MRRRPTAAGAPPVAQAAVSLRVCNRRGQLSKAAACCDYETVYLSSCSRARRASGRVRPREDVHLRLRDELEEREPPPQRDPAEALLGSREHVPRNVVIPCAWGRIIVVGEAACRSSETAMQPSAALSQTVRIATRARGQGARQAPCRARCRSVGSAASHRTAGSHTPASRTAPWRGPPSCRTPTPPPRAVSGLISESRGVRQAARLGQGDRRRRQARRRGARGGWSGPRRAPSPRSG